MNSGKKYKYEYFLDYETDLQLISSPFPLPIWLIAVTHTRTHTHIEISDWNSLKNQHVSQPKYKKSAVIEIVLNQFWEN